jgi:hypothetical protein
MSLISGTRLALVVTAGGEMKDNLDLTVAPFREFAEFFKCKNAGTLLIPDCTTPEKLGAAVEQQAREFARTLTNNVA